ncbi:MAG: DUF4340 domain-containing protein [Chloroflexi bacterium]|nr:DUF4340 domain-containing protein [Chloroflexota bacterium]
MNFKMTMTLAGVLAVLLTAVWLTRGESPAAAPTSVAATTGPELISGAATDISDITVVSGGQSVAVHRQSGDDWVYGVGAAAPSLPADGPRIRSLATRLGGLKALSVIAQQPDAAALKEFGLDNPSSVVTVKSGGAEKKLAVGIESPVGSGRYVQVDGGGPVYLVQTFLLDDVKGLTTTPPVPPTPTATPAVTATPTAGTATSPTADAATPGAPPATSGTPTP